MNVMFLDGHHPDDQPADQHEILTEMDLWRIDPDSQLAKRVKAGKEKICGRCGSVDGDGPCPGRRFWYRFDDYWYRFDDYWYVSEQLISESKMRVVRETPQGVWLGHSLGEEIWCSNNAERRRYYPTRELAFRSYAIRKMRHQQRLQSKLDDVTEIRAIIEQGLEHYDSLNGRHQRRPYSSAFFEDV